MKGKFGNEQNNGPPRFLMAVGAKRAIIIISIYSSKIVHAINDNVKVNIKDNIKTRI